jgi:hypothetical protein
MTGSPKVKSTGYIQLLRCGLPPQVMLGSTHSEEDLDVEFNYVPVDGLLPASEFDTLADVYGWFHDVHESMGWKTCLRDFDIINVVHTYGRVRKTARSHAYMIATPATFAAVKWVRENYRKVSLVREESGGESAVWALPLVKKITLIGNSNGRKREDGL